MTPRLALLLLAVALPLASCSSAGKEAEREASLGLEEARAGNIPAAMARFERALELDGDNPKARYNLALAHLVFRRGPEAATHLRRFLATRPDDAPARFELARALALSGEREAALAELQRAVELGFSDFRALDGGGFEAIEDDVRYVQARVLLAQRAGMPAYPEEGRPASGVGYGGVPVPVQLPGMGPARKCDQGPEGGGEACGPEGTAAAE